MKLLIHHHGVAYRDGAELCLPSFLGPWVDALASRVERLGLLLHESATRTPRQDTRVRARNVVLHSLGAPEKRSAARNQRIRSVAASAARAYDALLIRGVTPRQALIHSACAVPLKSFLLVCSIRDSVPRLEPSRTGLVRWSMHHVRMHELRRIARDSVMLANSPATVAELREDLGCTAAFVPTNAIAARDFVPPEPRPFRPVPELLFCGRVVPDKGIEELIEAVAMLRDAGRPCTLRVVGAATPAYRARLAALTDARGITDAVHFEGFIAYGERLLEQYRKADIYVLPSRHEGFPHSVWEAAASFTPIVVTPVGGVPGLVSDREVTFTPPDDAPELARTILRLLADPLDAHGRAERAWHCAQRFTVDRCADMLVDALRPDALVRL